MADSNENEKDGKPLIPPFLAEVGGQNRVTIPPVIRKLLGEIEQGDIVLILGIKIYKRKGETGSQAVQE